MACVSRCKNQQLPLLCGRNEPLIHFFLNKHIVRRFQSIHIHILRPAPGIIDDLDFRMGHIICKSRRIRHKASPCFIISSRRTAGDFRFISDPLHADTIAIRRRDTSHMGAMSQFLPVIHTCSPAKHIGHIDHRRIFLLIEFRTQKISGLIANTQRDALAGIAKGIGISGIDDIQAIAGIILRILKIRSRLGPCQRKACSP